MMRVVLLLLLIFSPCSIAKSKIEKMAIIADEVGTIDMYIQAYQLFDKQCGMKFSLSESEIHEIDNLVKIKSGFSLEALKEQIGVSGESPFLWGLYENVNGDVESCKKSAMFLWRKKSRPHFEGALERLRVADSVVQ